MIVEGVIAFRNSTDIIPSYADKNAICSDAGWLNLRYPASRNVNNSRILVGVSPSGEDDIKFKENNISDSFWIAGLTDSTVDPALFEKAEMVAWYQELKGTLLLSRDIFGTIPLYYLHIPGVFIAFSTSLVSLMKMPCSRPYMEIDAERVASYCDFQKDQGSGYTSRTFYKAVKTVLPGHFISVSSEGITSAPYTSLNPEKWEELRSKEEYGMVFKGFLRKSVKRSSEDHESMASHLSGGLDSSSVSTMFRDIFPGARLHTLYSETRTRYTDEAVFATSVAKQIDSVHHNIDPPANDFETISLYTSLYGHPECMVLSPSLQGSLIQYARELGCETLLIGHDGDSVVGTGLDLTHEAFFSKNWEKLKDLIAKRAEHAPMHKLSPDWESYSPERKYKAYVQNFTVSRYFEIVRKLPVLKAFRLMIEISRKMDVPVWRFFEKGLKSIAGKLRSRDQLPQSIIKAGISHKSGKVLENAATSLANKLPEKYRNAFVAVYNAQSMIANEQFFTLGNYYGIHNRFPLYDKELFELCMATPPEIKFGNGLGRGHFREAMKGLLPENVRTRPSKANFSLYGRQAVIRLYHQSKDLMQDRSNPVWSYIDKNKYEKAVSVLLRENAQEFLHNRSQFQVLRTISLAIWLDWLTRFQSDGQN
ncbi:asparagine synthase-related protein [Dyadobacter bucti]|uniref:asparagine synthase-related protein n=1 Tax=Dyadobacter bucti TaxID=2572203 RepID=UPI003F6EA34E